jgi:hypothetical protein
VVPEDYTERRDKHEKTNKRKCIMCHRNYLFAGMHNYGKSSKQLSRAGNGFIFNKCRIFGGIYWSK